MVQNTIDNSPLSNSAAEGLATRKAAATFFQVSTETIKRWGKNPEIELREIAINSRVIRYFWDDIYALAEVGRKSK